eukprot:2210236-Rhodomonas_salina.1
MCHQDHFDDLCLDSPGNSLEAKCVIENAPAHHSENKQCDENEQPANRKDVYAAPFASSKNWHIDTHHLEFETKNPVLGSGAIGVVVKATFRGTPVAVKVLRVSTDCKWKFQNAVLDMEQELAVVSNCQRHPNIIFCFGCCSVDKAGESPIPMIVYEMLGGGSLLQLFQRKSAEVNGEWVAPPQLALSWCHQLTRAVEFLHTTDTPVAHRDIKLDNLLVSEDLRTLKLTDFSLATSLHERGRGIIGSMRYMAPECHGKEEYNLGSADIYSCAITMWCILHGRRPFYNVAETPLVVGLVVMGARPQISKDKHGLQKCLESAWHADPNQRPSATQLAKAVEEACKKNDRKPWK